MGGTGVSKRRLSAGAMARTVLAAGCIMSMFALLGCTDKRAASKANFKKALDAYYATHCIPFGLDDFITDLPVELDSNPAGQTVYIDSKARALTAAGMLTRNVVQRDIKNLAGMVIGQNYKVDYDLTPAGRALYSRPKAVNALIQPPGSFCGGHLTVVSVDSYTTPAPEEGHVVSEVTFSAKLRLEDWARNPQVQAAFKDEFEQIAGTTGQTVVVQTNDGWVDAHNLVGY